MSETEPFPEEELARQARQHLESLCAAGVDWLPDGHAPRPQPAGAASAAPTPSPTTETPVQPAAGDIQGRLWGPGSAPAAAPEGVSGLTVEQRKEPLARAGPAGVPVYTLSRPVLDCAAGRSSESDRSIRSYASSARLREEKKTAWASRSSVRQASCWIASSSPAA